MAGSQGAMSDRGTLLSQQESCDLELVDAVPVRRHLQGLRWVTAGAALVAVALASAGVAALASSAAASSSLSSPSSPGSLLRLDAADAAANEEEEAPIQTEEEEEEEDEEKDTSTKEAEKCGMARKGDPCFDSVVWAMTKGLKEHPEWYKGLTKKSLFEEFQANAALSPKDTKCDRKPCKAPSDCKTAEPDSECGSGVMWDMTKGIKKEPKWYPGLTADSTYEEFQAHSHKTNKTKCPTAPCNKQPYKLLTLFCWMAVQADGYEMGLASAQLEKKVGIFACDDFAVVSSKELNMDGARTLVISNMAVGGYTNDGTSPNAPIFVEAWQKIAEDGKYNEHDWTVKTDPDAVLLPDRLREKLLPENQPENPYPPPYKSDPSLGLWVTNCDKMAGWGKGWGDGWPMMYGSLEAVSREGLNTYYDGVESCKGSMPWQGMGEDAYLGMCLRQLKVGELFWKNADGTCAGGACSDQSFVLYHPYKDAGSWFDCYGQATGS